LGRPWISLIYIISKGRIRKVYNCNGYASHGIVFPPSHEMFEWKKKQPIYGEKYHLLLAAFDGKNIFY
jgi:hypothetical protein